jgi:DNA polymerase
MATVKQERKFMVLDYETFSELDIKKSGAFEYAVHPSTEILCVAFKIGTREQLKSAPTHLWVPESHDCTDNAFQKFYQALLNHHIELVAHNAFFEKMITKHIFGKRLNYSKEYLQNIPNERWHCTAALARSVGLPGKLEMVGHALNLTAKKDTDGHRVMLKLSKPRKPTKNNDAVRWTPESAPDDFQKLYDYCVKDIGAEVELFLKLPPMHTKEREFWLLDQKINERGFKVDRGLVKSTLKLIKQETEYLDNNIVELTEGEVNSARQNQAMIDYLKDNYSVELPNMQAATITEFLEKDIHENARVLLEIRAAISRAATSKFKAFENRTRYDGRARDNIIFYGAHTGRDAGTGLQPQNLFKSVFSHDDVLTGIELIKRGDRHTIEALYKKPLTLYASVIRSCIVAEDGYTLDVGDFSTVEVRVLFWLAEHAEGLKAFATGKDLYIEMAADIYGDNAGELQLAHAAKTKDAGNKRQLGKQTVLGAGFGIGVNGKKFQATCKQYGIDISISLAQKAIRLYRKKHKPIPKFWETIEEAAIRAVQNPGKAFKHGLLTWECNRDFLTVKLPIGRRLYYYKPRVTQKQTKFGPTPELSYMGIEAKSKKFLRLSTWGGKLTENVVQAVARDLLMESALRIENRGLSRVVLKVHDEIVGERKRLPAGENDLGGRKFIFDMETLPDWAEGLPVKVEGWSEPRYRK